MGPEHGKGMFGKGLMGTVDGELERGVTMQRGSPLWQTLRSAQGLKAQGKLKAAAYVGRSPKRSASIHHLKPLPLGLRRRVLLVWVVLFFALGILAVFPGIAAAQGEESLEERALALDKQLICPVCPGESIYESRATLAKQMRAVVRDRLGAGESEKEILDYFVSVYGNSVLAEPPKEGFTLAIWLVPPLALVLGVVALALTVRAMRRRQVSLPDAAAGGMTQGELRGYLSMVDEELGGPRKPA